MKERPILFNAAMVRAILDGRKTQTRRVIRPQPILRKARTSAEMTAAWQAGFVPVSCPYGRVGDKLWVRETFSQYMHFDPEGYNDDPEILYRATDEERLKTSKNKDISGNIKWKPSTHMPRWASRIQLRITDIRVERVADISDGDALREGIKPSDVAARGYCDARVAFKVLWNSINTDPGKTWADNPWVWAVEFEHKYLDAKSISH